MVAGLIISTEILKLLTETEIQFLMVKEVGVGFPFRNGLDEGWELGFERLVEFKDKHGHYNVTRRDCELGLGGFV